MSNGVKCVHIDVILLTSQHPPRYPIAHRRRRLSDVFHRIVYIKFVSEFIYRPEHHPPTTHCTHRTTDATYQTNEKKICVLR